MLANSYNQAQPQQHASLDYFNTGMHQPTLTPQRVNQYLKMIGEAILFHSGDNRGVLRKQIWAYLMQKNSPKEIDYRDFLLSIQYCINDERLLNENGYYKLQQLVYEDFCQRKIGSGTSQTHHQIKLEHNPNQTSTSTTHIEKRKSTSQNQNHTQIQPQSQFGLISGDISSQSQIKQEDFSEHQTHPMSRRNNHQPQKRETKELHHQFTNIAGNNSVIQAYHQNQKEAQNNVQFNNYHNQQSYLKGAPQQNSATLNYCLSTNQFNTRTQAINPNHQNREPSLQKPAKNQRKQWHPEQEIYLEEEQTGYRNAFTQQQQHNNYQQQDDDSSSNHSFMRKHVQVDPLSDIKGFEKFQHKVSEPSEDVYADKLGPNDVSVVGLGFQSPMLSKNQDEMSQASFMGKPQLDQEDIMPMTQPPQMHYESRVNNLVQQEHSTSPTDLKIIKQESESEDEEQFHITNQNDFYTEQVVPVHQKKQKQQQQSGVNRRANNYVKSQAMENSQHTYMTRMSTRTIQNKQNDLKKTQSLRQKQMKQNISHMSKRIQKMHKQQPNTTRQGATSTQSLGRVKVSNVSDNRSTRGTQQQGTKYYVKSKKDIPNLVKQHVQEQYHNNQKQQKKQGQNLYTQNSNEHSFGSRQLGFSQMSITKNEPHNNTRSQKFKYQQLQEVKKVYQEDGTSVSVVKDKNKYKVYYSKISDKSKAIKKNQGQHHPQNIKQEDDELIEALLKENNDNFCKSELPAIPRKQQQASRQQKMAKQRQAQQHVRDDVSYYNTRYRNNQQPERQMSIDLSKSIKTPPGMHKRNNGEIHSENNSRSPSPTKNRNNQNFDTVSIIQTRNQKAKDLQQSQALLNQPNQKVNYSKRSQLLINQSNKMFQHHQQSFETPNAKAKKQPCPATADKNTSPLKKMLSNQTISSSNDLGHLQETPQTNHKMPCHQTRMEQQPQIQSRFSLRILDNTYKNDPRKAKERALQNIKLLSSGKKKPAYGYYGKSEYALF